MVLPASLTPRGGRLICLPNTISCGKDYYVLAKENYLKKIWNAAKKLVSGKPLGKQTAVAPTTTRAAVRGHAAGEYHYGRVSQVKDENGNFKAYRVGPIPDPSGETYRGARQASLDHVIKALKKLKVTDPRGRVTVCIYGRMYKNRKGFTWICEVFNRDQMIKSLTAYINAGETVESAAMDIFGLDTEPDLVLAWEVRQHKARLGA